MQVLNFGQYRKNCTRGTGTHYKQGSDTHTSQKPQEPNEQVKASKDEEASS